MWLNTWHNTIQTVAVERKQLSLHQRAWWHTWRTNPHCWICKNTSQFTATRQHAHITASVSYSHNLINLNLIFSSYCHNQVYMYYSSMSRSSDSSTFSYILWKSSLYIFNHCRVFLLSVVFLAFPTCRFSVTP